MNNTSRSSTTTSKQRLLADPMAGVRHVLAGFALVAGLANGGAQADAHFEVSPRVSTLVAGLFCAPPEGERRPAPDTIAGWIHAPDAPVEMIAEGQVVPAVIGLGFGVRYLRADDQDARVHYTVTHPPMPPSNLTEQSWDSPVSAGYIDSAFFQFDIEDELQPGDWSFRASIGGEQLFDVGFTVRPASELPHLAALCRGGTLLSFNQSARAAAG